MTRVSVNPSSGIGREELLEALPDSLRERRIHLHWVEMARNAVGTYILTCKLEVDEEILLLQSRTTEEVIIRDWHHDDPVGPVNPRLLALDRILTDPANEERILSL